MVPGKNLKAGVVEPSDPDLGEAETSTGRKQPSTNSFS
jgi:hypothetical protein